MIDLATKARNGRIAALHGVKGTNLGMRSRKSPMQFKSVRAASVKNIFADFDLAIA